jgi:Rha family phage regulatory protein
MEMNNNMNELVFVEKQEVYTDHLTMAKMFGKLPKNVKADITLTMERLEDADFVVLAKTQGIKLDGLKFQLISYKDSMNRTQEKYILNFDAFMLVAMAYTTTNAMLVKVKYINEFRDTQEQLTQFLIARAKGKATRLQVSTAVNEAFADSKNLKWKHKHFTDLTYKVVLGLNCKQLKEDRGLLKTDNLRDFLSVEEIEMLDTVENELSVLIGYGIDYHQAKEMLTKKYEKSNQKKIAQ